MFYYSAHVVPNPFKVYVFAEINIVFVSGQKKKEKGEGRSHCETTRPGDKSDHYNKMLRRAQPDTNTEVEPVRAS